MTALHPTNILGDSSGSGRFADFFGGLAMVFDDYVPWACALVDFATERPLASVSLPLALSFGKAVRARVDVLQPIAARLESSFKSFGSHS